tara:strand:- start:1009 stop:1338 length:330 start_codon:yes stop_codon:yes gene_type:complete
MAKVYIVQENPNVNVIGAGRFGDLIPLLPPGRQITLSSAPVKNLLKIKLKDFNDKDFLLAMGDPVAIAIASMVASDINNGKVNMLKWDRENQCYYNVPIDLYQKGESNE